MARRTPRGRTPSNEPDLFSRVEAPREPAPVRADEPLTLSVGELTDRISGHLEGLGKLRVEGEISGLKRAASGHVYFDLKDDRARVSCAIWKSRAARMKLENLREGDEVVVHGKLDVYRPRGSYSLIVEKLEPKGIGALLAKLEELKARLAKAGRFDRKRPLPAMPRLVGVVTSRDGAALRDFLRTRSLRWPGYPVRLCHSNVQGPGSAAGIADAIDRLGASGVDLVVVTRGGGSIEDLWAFNEEPVLDAIWRCPVPVVSAVGHETDTTLADYQADHRAHTPTDAAQLVFPDRSELLERLTRVGNYLVGAANRLVDERGEALTRLAERRVLSDPSWIVADREAQLTDRFRRIESRMDAILGASAGRLGALGARLERQSPKARIERWEARLARAGQKLVTAATRATETREQRVAVLARALDGISPLRVLGRGYSYTSLADGTSLKSASELEVGTKVVTRLAQGSFEAEVTEVRPTDAHETAGDDA